MHYLIDGHNLIGYLTDLSLDDPNDEAILVQKLTGFCARTGARCTVVFDQGLPGGRSRMSTQSVQVIFASHRSNADRVMLDRITKVRDPRQSTVISSDNAVLNEARRRRLKSLKSAEFSRMLQREQPPAKPGADEDANLHLSDDEVDEWIQLFGGGH